MYNPKWVILKRESDTVPWQLHQHHGAKHTAFKYDSIDKAAPEIRRLKKSGHRAMAVRADRVLQYGVSLIQ